MKTKKEQAVEFKAILDKYDPKIQKLYNEILRFCGKEATHITPQKATREKILDMVKAAAK